IKAGIAPMQGLNECLAAIRGAADFAAACKNVGEIQPVDVAPRADGQPTCLNEWDAKRAVAAHGLPIPDGAICRPGDAAANADDLGYPLVAKILSTEIAHKTEVGGVILDLQDAGQVAAAAARLGQIGDTVLLERMARAPIVELLVGVRRDPQFGLALVIGAGGTLTELLDDSVSLLFPVSREDLSRAIDSLRISRMINGFRGGPAGDREAAIDAIAAVASYAEANRDSLVELDINPLLVLEDGAIAVDAFISRLP
ncbi:MAG: acetate--CoA ligase family protein, partial [Gammaproteobacteria bacterium]|nr:acetate--CoA ligase family protein [Gammaproteobacteria bacterium]